MQTYRCTDKHLKNCQREIQPLLPQELYIRVRTLNSAVVTYQVRTSTTLLRSALTRVCKNRNNEYEYHDKSTTRARELSGSKRTLHHAAAVQQHVTATAVSDIHLEVQQLLHNVVQHEHQNYDLRR